MTETIDTNQPKPFKFKELKIYGSTEWLADNKKKYRQVFDRYETSYVYAELSLYNKYFDIDDWEIEVELHCYSTRKGKTEVCILPFTRKVSKFDPTIYIREGWGNKKDGAFWKRGTYYWEAWVEGEKVCTKYFYVEDTGVKNSPDYSPYCELASLRLYEGPYDDIIKAEREYMRGFHADETRYIYAEVELRNNYITKAWQCEIFIKFYNDARELKGQIVRLQRVERGEDAISMTAGWGSNVKGSWRKDRYTAEIVFMDRLIAVIPFEVGDQLIEGVGAVMLPFREQPLVLTQTVRNNLSFDELILKLDQLIGLQEVKQKVKDYAQYVQFIQLRKDKGFLEKEEIQLHTIFTGNPGTGKTTVAQMMGKLYRSLGLLTKGHVVEVDRSDLVGEYIGQTAPKVKEAVERARGGVLFIDEAYALARSADDSKDFGREVIEILVKEMSNGVGDLAVIMAGYPKEMKLLLDTNPGLKSRFKMTFEFQDYLPQDLVQIADLVAQDKMVVFDDLAHTRIRQIITDAYRKRDKAFGNARFVINIVEQAKMNMALRVMSVNNPSILTKEELSTILLADIEKIESPKIKNLPNIGIDERLLTETLSELDALVGMKNIKDELHELVKIVRYHKENGRDVLKKFHFHTILTGNPGTGKTTVARIFAKLLKALGILERGHIVETDRQGLVAGFVGQTAIKTAENVEQALGGVLFIDEAYSLTTKVGNASGDFGDEAIQTILKRMEDNRGDFFIFAAGYPENMDNFLKANPGLHSRFDRTLKFEDYNANELFEIMLYMIHQEHLSVEEDAISLLKNYCFSLHEKRDQYFGNARTVRQSVNELVKKHHLRLANTDENARNAGVITAEDAQSMSLSIDEKELSSALVELNNLVGLENVKKNIIEWVNSIKLQKTAGQDVLKKLQFNTIFVGNEGTGKTTVSRILSRIFKALGLVEKGQFIETPFENLVSFYAESSFSKLPKEIESAKGGFLSIDETQVKLKNLVDSEGAEHLKNTTQSILQHLKSESKNEMILFAIGHPLDIETFLNCNHELEKVFENTLIFNEYSATELFEIAKSMIAESRFTLSDEATDYLKKYCSYISFYREDFQNAKTIRISINDVIKKHHSRVSNTVGSPQSLGMITIEDVQILKMENK